MNFSVNLSFTKASLDFSIVERSVLVAIVFRGFQQEDGECLHVEVSEARILTAASEECICFFSIFQFLSKLEDDNVVLIEVSDVDKLRLYEEAANVKENRMVSCLATTKYLKAGHLIKSLQDFGKVKIPFNTEKTVGNFQSEFGFLEIGIARVNLTEGFSKMPSVLEPNIQKRFQLLTGSDIIACQEELYLARTFLSTPEMVLSEAQSFWDRVLFAWTKSCFEEGRSTLRVFKDQEEAEKAGFFQISFKVESFTGIRDGASQDSSSTKSTKSRDYFDSYESFKSLISNQAKKYLKGDSRGMNVYGEVFFYDATIENKLFIGRTNVEYSTFDAHFGTNSSSHLCESGKPKLGFEVNNPMVRLSQEDSFLFFVPRNFMDSHIEVTFFNEKYSMLTGCKVRPLATTRVLMSDLGKKSYEIQDEQSHMSGCFAFKMSHSKSTQHVTMNKAMDMTNIEFIFDTCQGEVKLLDEARDAFDKVKHLLQTQRREWVLLNDNDILFKSSQTKQEFKRAVFATNLHVTEFSCKQEELSRKDDLLFDSKCSTTPSASSHYTFITCGVPSGLGLYKSELAFSKCSLQGFMKALSLDSIECLSSTLESLLSPTETLRFLKTRVSKGKSQHFLLTLLLDAYFRFVLVLSQYMTVLITNVLCQIDALVSGRIDLANFMTLGKFLVCFESLISSTGKELMMLEDFTVMTEYIANKYCIKFYDSDSTGLFYELKSSSINIYLTKKQKQIVSRFGSINREFSLCICSFTQGINEAQTIALVSEKLAREAIDVLGKFNKSERFLEAVKTSKVVSSQLELNRSSFKKLLSIGKDFADLSCALSKLEVLLQSNESEIEVDVLHLSNLIIMKLVSTKIIFCKSGKDRTAMATTYEQIAFMTLAIDPKNFLYTDLLTSNTKLEVEEDVDQDLLAFEELSGLSISQAKVFGRTLLNDLCAAFREKGVRLCIAEKNIGRKLYSFNQIQLNFLPEEFRPPKHLIQSLMLSIQARDS